jgi:hypothetical protein
MKIAHLIPTHWCWNYDLGDYRFALAHWIKVDKTSYTAPMKKGNSYMIMDNGAFEGELLTDDELLKAAEQIGADEIVLPDVPGDPKATLSASYKAYKKFRKYRTMFVPHGQSLEEWIECVDAWVSKINEAPSTSQPDYHTIGISPLRYLDGGYKHTKEMIVHVIGLDMPIHLLGLADMSYFTSELLPNLTEWDIRGIDTSYAFALGARGILLQPDSPKVNLGDVKQYNVLSTNQRRLVALNIAILNSWIADGAVDPRGLPDMVIRKTASNWVLYYQRQFERLEMVMRICGISGSFIVRDDFVKPYTEGDPFDKDIDWIISI